MGRRPRQGERAHGQHTEDAPVCENQHETKYSNVHYGVKGKKVDWHAPSPFDGRWETDPQFAVHVKDVKKSL